MATIKSYTDINQSKKLTEILPLESADMYWRSLKLNGHISWTSHIKRLEPPLYDFEHYAPCWSLAALLDVLPKNLNIGRPLLCSNYKGYYWIQYYDEFMKPNNYETECFNNPVDACVDMIKKLYELNLL